jgi:tetratricopeptide (TPR) repeat protein
LPEFVLAHTLSEVPKPKPKKYKAPEPPSGRPKTIQPILTVAGLFCLCVAIYWPALRGPKIWDDDVLLGPAVRSINGLAAIWGGRQVDFLPVTSSLLWIEWRIWGDAVAGYRMVNIALHAASSFLLFKTLNRVTGRGALLAAILFCVHPICVGTVAWIAELKNTLSLCFALLATYFFLISRKDELQSISEQARVLSASKMPDTSGRGFYYVLSVLCFALALLSKISVVMLPFVLVGLDWWPKLRQGSSAGLAATIRAATRVLMRVAPFFALSFITGILNIWFQRHHAMAFATAADQEALVSRVLGGGYAIWFYLWKSVLPLNLMPIYPRWEINPSGLTDWLPGFLWLATLGLCWWRSGSSKGFRVVFWGLAFFSVTLVPVLGVVQIVYLTISRVADHLQYLSLIGICAVAGYTLDHPFAYGKAHYARLALPVTLVLVLSAASFHRAQLFGEPEKLWRDNLAKNPRAAAAWANLAQIESKQGRLTEALNDFNESVKLEPADLTVRENLAATLLSAGRYDEAIVEYRQLLARKGNNGRIHTNLGTALARKGSLDEAVEEFKTAVALAPGFADAHKNLGAGLYKQGHFNEAIEQLEMALEINPSFPGARELLSAAQQRKAAGTNHHAL